MGRLKGTIDTFSSHKHSVIGRIYVIIPVSHSFFLSFDAGVFDTDVPFVLSLDVLTAYSLTVYIFYISYDKLSTTTDYWILPLVRMNGHEYLSWTVRSLYTDSRLRKIRSHFYHLDSEKSCTMTHRAKPKEFSPDPLDYLELVSSTFDVFQREEDALHRFRVALPSQYCFSAEWYAWT